MNRPSIGPPANNPQHKAQKPTPAKRPWGKPKVMEEDFRNTEQQPGMPPAPLQSPTSS